MKTMMSAALMIVLLTQGEAKALLVLYAQQSGVNGGAITTIASGADFTNDSFTGQYGDFTLILDGAASTNSAALSSLLGATVSLRNTTDSTATINLYASQTNYSLPLGSSLNVESGLSGTVNTGTLTGTGVFTAFADTNNQLLGSSFSNGPQAVSFTGSTFDTGSATGVFDRLNPLYSLTTQITATVSGGGEGNFSWHENVSAATAVPEPPTLAMAITGMLTVGAYLRRRKA
jgi:hypothetical protein